MLKASALLLSIALLPVVSNAGDAVEYGPAPAWVQPVAIPADLSPSTDAPARSLLKNFQLRFTATTSEFFSESFVRVQTPQGLQSLGNVVLPWKPESDVLTVHRFRLLRGKQVIDILADGQKFEVLRRENNLEYSALDGMLTAALQPAGIEVGDVLDMAFTLKREYRTVPSPEFILVGLVESPPAERVELRAIWDKSVPMKWRATADIAGAVEKQDGNMHELRWAAAGPAVLDQPTDVPVRFYREPLIEFSTFPSWKDVSRRLAPLYVDAARLTANSVLRTEIASIAAASADPVQRMEAALKLAQERVRYVFLGMAEGSLKPASADETWQRRFGDCKGKTALLIAVLHELGISADPVAVNTRLGDAVKSRLPGIGSFDHVIVRAEASGKTWWLDGTGSSSWRRADMVMPNYRWGLPLTTAGAELVAMDAPPAAEPQMETETELDARAGLHTAVPFKATMRLRGAMGAGLHAQLAQMTPLSREQMLKRYWKEQYDFVEPKIVKEEFDADSGFIRVSVEGTATMDWGGNSYVTDGMRTGAPADFKRETAVNAEAPFVIAHPLFRVTRQRIQLPDAVTFTLKGGNYDAELAGTRYVRNARLENHVFTGEVSVRSLASEVSAAAARAAERKLNDMWNDKLEIHSKDYSPNDADVAALRERKFEDVPNLVWRGNILMRKGDYNAALKDFDAAVKMDPKKANSLAHRGLLQYWRGDNDAARADLDAALALEPRNAVALRALGALEYKTYRFPQALTHLSESLKSDPENEFALSMRAKTFVALGETEKALVDAADALRVAPSSPEMYGLRAWIFAQDGKVDDAQKEIEAMKKAAPDSPSLQWQAAQAYGRMGKHADAVAAMDRYVAAYPDAAAYLARASVRDPADIKGSLDDVNLALAKEPANAAAIELHTGLLIESGDRAAAIAEYSERIRKTTAFTAKRRLLSLRGVQYALSGKRDEANRDFAAALANEPDGDAYNNHCWALAASRIDLQTALEACDKALKAAPKDASYLDSRGFVLLQMGRFDDSIAAYDAALALSPRIPTSLFGRGVAKNRRCKCSEGEADIAAGMKILPRVRHEFAKANLAP